MACPSASGAPAAVADVPVLVNAPMARIAGGALAAAVTRAGGLGFIGGGYGDMAWIDEQLAIAGDVPVGVGLITWALTDRSDIVQHVLDRGVRWLWLSFGDPVPYIGLDHAAEAVVACQVQAVDEARRAVAAGADIIVAQGHEAGRHGRNNDGLATLLPAVVAAVTRCAYSLLAVSPPPPTVAGRWPSAPLASPSAPASTSATKPPTPTQPKRRSSPHPPRAAPPCSTSCEAPTGPPATPAEQSSMPPSSAGSHEAALRQVLDAERRHYRAAVAADDVRTRVVWAGTGVSEIIDIRATGDIVRAITDQRPAREPICRHDELPSR